MTDTSFKQTSYPFSYECRGDNYHHNNIGKYVILTVSIRMMIE